MVIGKSLLGAGARIPCIRTRLQVKFGGGGVSFHVLSISRAQEDTILLSTGREMLSPALQPLVITSLSDLPWYLSVNLPSPNQPGISLASDSIVPARCTPTAAC